jgi:hypothetical protein
MHKPLLLLISAGSLISCQKEASNPVNNITWFGTQNKAVYNYVLINANQVLTHSDTEELHVGINAAFIDSNNNQINIVRALYVNNVAIQPSQDSTYSYNYASGATDKGLPLFGTKVLVTIRGTEEADTVTSSLYLPKQLTGVLASDYYPDVLSRRTGMQLSWATDDENTWGNVMIQLFYFNTLSRKNDSTLPDKIQTVNLTVPDNGGYYLTKADLASFPGNAYIGITIARGTQTEAILPLSRKRVYYFSSASVSTPPVKVIN